VGVKHHLPGVKKMVMKNYEVSRIVIKVEKIPAPGILSPIYTKFGTKIVLKYG